jgi:hypothetical protein
MRQRQALERSIAGYKKLERELDDAVTLIELGESEDDAASIEEGEAACASSPRRRGARRWRRCCRARPTATTPTSRCTPAPAAPRARTGRDALAHVHRAGPRTTTTRCR